MGKLLKIVGVGVLGLGAFWLVRAISRHPVGNPAVPEPCKPVDLTRYTGRWYEIARYDQSFERGCEVSTADYNLDADGKISVVNTCRQADGRLRSISGKAVVVDPLTNAKLKISFYGPFYIGNYWILDHDEDYQWAIVGESSGRYLWLLNRTAEPGEEEITALVERAGELGYDVSMLMRTVQP